MKYKVTEVRLGEHDLRSEQDCEEVNEIIVFMDWLQSIKNA